MKPLRISVGWLVLVAALSAQSVKIENEPVRFHLVQPPVLTSILYDMGKPDLMIKNSFEVDFLGNDVYNDDGLHQTKEQNVDPGETAIYNIRVQNDADFQRLPDNITVKGPASDSGFAVSYFHTISGDITLMVTTTGWSTGPLDYGSYEQIRVEVTTDPDVPEGSVYEVLVTGKSDNEPDRDDAVKAVTTINETGALEEPSTPAPQKYFLDVTSAPSGSVAITYGLARESDVVLAVYDVTGREVRELVSERASAGSYSLEWDGRNTEGEELPSGVYFVRLEAGSYMAARKLILVR
jgi:hypothetical protein